MLIDCFIEMLVLHGGNEAEQQRAFDAVCLHIVKLQSSANNHGDYSENLLVS
jgi:hypothetical protein